jgi:hypothetical protein
MVDRRVTADCPVQSLRRTDGSVSNHSVNSTLLTLLVLPIVYLWMEERSTARTGARHDRIGLRSSRQRGSSAAEVSS